MGKVKYGAKEIQGKSIDEYAEMINQEIIKNLLKKSKIEVGKAIEIHKLLKKNSEYNGENLGYKDDKIESYTISSASDMITILSAGTAVAAKVGIVTFIQAFWPLSKKTTAINFTLSTG